jgi:hypothetical protein
LPILEGSTGACFIVRDKNGHALAYVYLEHEHGRRTAAKLLTRDEARRIAANIAKLQEPLPPWSVEDHNDGFIVEDWNPFTLGIPFRGSKTLIGLVLINEVCSRLPLL